MPTSEQASSPPSPEVGARVLIAEDHALVALHLMTTLQAASYVVVGPVSSVAETLTIVNSAPPDVALLDVRFVAGNPALVAATPSRSAPAGWRGTAGGTRQAGTPWPRPQQRAGCRVQTPAGRGGRGAVGHEGLLLLQVQPTSVLVGVGHPSLRG